MNDKVIGWATSFCAVALIILAVTWVPSSVANRAGIMAKSAVAAAVPSIHREVRLSHDRLPVVVGDPVYVVEDECPVQIGYVEFSDSSDVVLLLDGEVNANSRFEFHQTTGSLAEASGLLLPPDKRAVVAEMISRYAKDQGRQSVAAMIPIIERAIAGSVPVLEASLRASLERHQSEIDDVAGRFKRDVVNEQLIPLAKSRVLPIVRRHGEPPAQLIGRELWDRASLWGFAWRAALDRSRLASDDLVAKEWSRFVDEEAIEVLEQNSDLIVSSITNIILDAANDDVIRDGLADALSSVQNDPATRRLVQTVLRESIAENQSLRRVWSDALTSPEAMRIIDRAGRDLEPIVRQIGDVILGSADGGLSEGLTRVLRNQVLNRDRRWIMARDGTRDGTSDRSPRPAGVLVRSNENRILPPVHLVGTR